MSRLDRLMSGSIDRSALADFIAPAVLIVGPFLGSLYFHSYGIFNADVLALTAILLAAAAAVGAMLRRFRRSVLFRVAVYSALLLIAFDLQFDIGGYVKILAVALVLIVWALRAHVSTIISAMGLAFYASMFLFGSTLAPTSRESPTASARVDLPPLLHLIVDEHIGIEGIPPEVPGAGELQADLISHYTDRGFRVFGNAYGRYAMTVDAIPNVLNFTSSEVHEEYVGSGSAGLPIAEQLRKGGFAVPVERNAYFRILSDRGYRLRIYQPTYLDLCSARDVVIASCFSIPRNSLMHLRNVDVEWHSKARFMAAYMLSNQSHIYRRLWEWYGKRARPWLTRVGAPAPEWPWTDSSVGMGPAGAQDILARLRSDLADGPVEGTAFVAHLLHPHGPLLFDRECRPRRPLLKTLARRNWWDLGNLAEARQAKYPLYLEQVRCLTRQLSDLYEALDSVGALEDAVILVHGDHGSRISQPRPTAEGADSLADEMIADYFSTFFAVKAPGIAPGYDDTVIPIQDLLAALTASSFARADVEPDTLPFVLLTGGHGEPMLRVPIRPRPFGVHAGLGMQASRSDAIVEETAEPR